MEKIVVLKNAQMIAQDMVSVSKAYVIVKVSSQEKIAHSLLVLIPVQVTESVTMEPVFVTRTITAQIALFLFVTAIITEFVYKISNVYVILDFLALTVKI